MQRLAESIWMQKLDLSSTRVTGRGLASMHRMKSLRELSLMSTPIEDGDLAFLDFLPQLRNLNFGLTRITDAVMERIARLNQLEGPASGRHAGHRPRDGSPGCPARPARSGVVGNENLRSRPEEAVSRAARSAISTPTRPT